MEMLNSMLLAGGMWSTLIKWFAKGIVNYGWTIIVFTIVLKLVLSPLDFLQRKGTAKQQRMMAYMQPEINAINQKYAGDKARINAETNKIYKKYNSGLGGSCVIMLVTMVVSMVVFFTLYSSIRSFGRDKLYESYTELDDSYTSAYVLGVEQAELSYNNLPEEDKTLTLQEYTKTYAENYAVNTTKQTYKDLKKKHGWLWVKNVWKSDTKTSQFVDIKDYLKHYNIDAESEQGKALTERYNLITSSIIGEGKDNNGYYMLIFICALVTLLSQFISAKILAPKGQKLNLTNKIMMVAMPIFMLIFAWTSNVVFALYIITNSVMSTLLSTIISLITRKSGKKDVDILTRKGNVEVVEYSRNYKKQ